LIELIAATDRDRLAAKLVTLRQRNVALDAELMAEVASIIEDVRTRGEAALRDYALRFDGCAQQVGELKVSEKILEESASKADPSIAFALREAISRVRRFHEFERQQSWETEDSNGTRLGQRISAIQCAGVYVPGGSAAYPSSVVMNIVPAQVAGVERIVVATPPRTLMENPAVAVALCELEALEVYAIGGAQAIAALAYGTETVPAVDKITGPGNKYVAAAKKLVFGVVGIDSIAGPTEVVVIADESAPAAFVAADLLAQAEHGEDASSILITTSARLAEEVAAEVERQMRNLPRRAIIERSLAQYGALVVVEDLDRACSIVNELAPEHLEIMCRDSPSIAKRIRNAGAVFLGNYSPEAVGDYLAGPNHVLPTGRTARFSSALSVRDFVKHTNVIEFSAPETQATASLIATLARAEGLEAHAQSVLLRAEKQDD